MQRAYRHRVRNRRRIWDRKAWAWLGLVAMGLCGSLLVGCDEEVVEDVVVQETTADSPTDAAAQDPAAKDVGEDGDETQKDAAETAAKAAPVEEEPEAVEGSWAKVVAIRGKVKYLRGGKAKRLKKGMALQAGDTIKTLKRAKVRLKLKDDSLLALGPKSQMELTSLALGKARRGKIALTAGRFWFQVVAWAGGGSTHFEVKTPNATAGIRGTTVWGDTNVDLICALEGEVEVANTREDASAKEPVMLKQGECASKLGKGALDVLKPKPKKVKAFLRQVQLP